MLSVYKVASCERTVKSDDFLVMVLYSSGQKQTDGTADISDGRRGNQKEGRGENKNIWARGYHQRRGK